MRILALLLFATTAFADPSPDQLAKDRVDAAQKAYASTAARYKAGTATFDDTARWSQKWLESALDVPKADVKKVLADYVARTTDAETAAKDRVKTGVAPSSELDEAAYFRIEAQLWQARGKKN